MLKYVVSGFENLCIMIDKMIVLLNGYLFELFLGLTNIQFRNTYLFDRLANRLYVLIGIFMVFRVTFSLIQMLANPDMMSDKEKGIGKLATRVVISLSLLVLTPFIFEKAMELQSVVLGENIIGQVVLGAKTDNTASVKSQGKNLAFQVFKGFVSPNEDVSSAEKNDEKSNYNICKARYQDESIDNIDDLIHPYPNNPGKLNCITDYDSNGESPYTYLFLVSTIGSLVLAWMVVGFCIDVATRLIKLGFYQIIAPIPIITYINGDKNGPFNTWVKKCISTYISVFIKLLIIYFVIYMCSIITRSGIDFDAAFGANASLGIKSLAKVAVILGLIVFAKIAPNLIKNMFGIKDDEESGGFVKSLAKAALLGGAGMMVGGASRLGANTRNFANVLKDKNAGVMDKFRAGAGILTGAGLGALSGGMRNARSGFSSKGWGSTFQDISKNNARMNEIANRRFKSQSAFRMDHPAGSDGRFGARLASIGTRAMDTGSNFIGGGTRAQRQDRVMENMKNIASLRDQIKAQADFFTGGHGVGNVKQLKQRYQDLKDSGTATEAEIRIARQAYENEQSAAISLLANDQNHAIHSLAVEMQKNVIEGQNSSYSQYFSGMNDIASGIFSDASTKSAFIDASNNQIIFQNTEDYKTAHSQSNSNNNNR